MKKHLSHVSTLLVLAAASALGACDAMQSITDAAGRLTQAVTADDAANSDASDPGANEADAADASPDRDGDGDGGRMGGHHGPGPGGFAGVDVPACVPPVADGVDIGRAGRPPHHLMPIYDEDESHDLSDTELAKLQADAAAGCEARKTAVLTGFDADADGVLSQTEWDAARDARRATRDADRAALDTDGDGTISEAEHQAAEAAVIATWDVDASGDLDATERAQMRTDLQALVRAGERLPPLPMFGARHGGHHHDGDHDGPPPDGMPPPPDDGTTP